MKEPRIREILARIENVTVAVYGDFCLDAYWILDPQGSEVSVETGLQARAVREHYYSLGGASNVVANAAALKPKAIRVIGAVGDDIFGRELRRQLDALGVDTTHLVIQRENFDTVTFAKPYLEGKEEPRVDFGFANRRSDATDEALLAGLRHALETADALIVNQQVPGSITHEAFIERANALFAEFSDKVILLDSRHYGEKFKHIYRKTNEREAAMLNGVEVGLDEAVPTADVRKYAENLYEQFHKPVFLTRGARGILIVDGAGVHEIGGLQFLKKLDTVGAGDTVTSALALCLGAGVPPAEAGEFANFAAGVTVQKLYQTGTASPEEVLAVGCDPDYIYEPELAEDRRRARYVGETGIELCAEALPFGHIRHAVFDNDGTFSTLRQGWEQVMAPVMVRAILGERYDTADAGLVQKVRLRVLDYIDKSTGIQTIVQMEALVEMVREFGLVPSEKVLDKQGYKRLYNEALMQMVNERQRLRRICPGLARTGRDVVPDQRDRPRGRRRRVRGAGVCRVVQRRHLRRSRGHQQVLQENGPREDHGRQRSARPGAGCLRGRAGRAARVPQARRDRGGRGLRRDPPARAQRGETHPPDQGRRPGRHRRFLAVERPAHAALQRVGLSMRPSPGVECTS